MSDIVKIYDTKVKRFFNELSEEKRNKIISDALNKGADILHAATYRALSSISEGAAKIAPTIGLKKTNYKFAKVALVGKKAEGIDYRLKWFEKGTKPRFRKNGGSTGTFRGYGYFKQVREGQYNIIMNNIISLLWKKFSKLMMK